MIKHKILEEVQQGHIMLFAFPFFVLLAMLCISKVCKVNKPKDNTKGSYSLPQNTLLLHCLECLVWSRAIISLTYVHHYLTGVVSIYILYAYYEIYTLQSVSRNTVFHITLPCSV